MLYLRSVLRSTLTRIDPDDFVVPLRVDVRAACGDTGREYTVGRLAADRVRWADAQAAGESTFAVCDNDSQGLCDLHAMPAELRQELADYFAAVDRGELADRTLAARPCLWLDAGRCRHYEWRPEVCRTFRAGSPACLAHRRAVGLPPVA